MSKAAKATSHRVFVTVGTDHHPFHRLVGWIHEWAARNPGVSVLVQRGEIAAPEGIDSVEMIGYDDLLAAMAGADAVVAQGGPAAIMDARSVGHRPIVVPRRGTLGEHVDDHQVTFSAWMAGRDLVWLADGEHDLGVLLDQAVADPSALRIPPESGAVEATVAAFAQVVDPLVNARKAVTGRRRAAGPR